MKKRLCLVLVFALIFSTSFSFSAFGVQNTDIEKTQLATSDTYYEYNAASKTLTVSGSGAMPDFKNSADSQPWYEWRSDGSIEHVVVDEGVTRIGSFAFYNVKANDFTLPLTLDSVGRYAFASTDITSFELPFGITAIDTYAFDNCHSLTNIILPDTLKTIGGYAFRSCDSLQSVVIPASVTSIGTRAFDKCESLSSAVFEDMTSSVSIGGSAFLDCNSLLSLAVPVGATVGKKFYGFTASGTVSGARLRVYNASEAHIYAINNSVSYTLLGDSFELLTGVKNTAEFESDSLDKVYAFTYTPQFTGDYNFYSAGEIDVKAELFEGETKLDEADDMSVTDRNFCLTCSLTEGVTYTFKVRTMNEAGSAKVVIYPDVINSFDIYGALYFSAGDGFRSGSLPYFPIVDSKLSDFVLDIYFDGGYSDKIYYSPGFFDNKTISIADEQRTSPFTCGENREALAIGDVRSTFPVYITHEYTGTVVPYTVDDDGYTVFTCVLCGDSYTGDIVPTPAITVSGRCLLKTDQEGNYDTSHPLTNSTVTFAGKTYQVDSEGRFSFRTLDSGTLTVHNPYCEDVTYTVTQSYRDINFGAIALPAYDFNGDGYINGRDLAVFKTELQDTLGRNYFDNAVNFM